MGDLQDGMLTHYLEQAKFSDANVEARIAREPFILDLKAIEMATKLAPKHGSQGRKTIQGEVASSNLDDTKRIAHSTKGSFNPGKGHKKGK